MPVIQDARTLLHFPDFRRLLSVRLLSQAADGIFQVALAAYVVFSPERQTSPTAIASAMAVLLLPYSLLGPFAGVLLDRWRRRQVLLYGNLLRAVLASGTALLVLSSPADWLFYLSALTVTAINRFILAGLSAALPRVVDAERLVIANSLSPTAGTVAATAGAGLAFGLRLLPGQGATADATVVATGAGVYLLAGLAALRMSRDALGPHPAALQSRLLPAIVGTVRGLLSGLRHLAHRSTAARALTGVALMRFSYGALTVLVLMLVRYAWPESDPQGTAGTGMALLGLAVAVSGAGFFTAAVVTPWAAVRLGRLGWFAVCAAAAAVLTPLLGLPFAPVPTLVAAFILGLTTQSAKICTDTVVQTAVDDAFRGRVFALYDMLFNVAFVAAAGVAALMLPPDGRSVSLILMAAGSYAVTTIVVTAARRTAPRQTERPVQSGR